MSVRGLGLKSVECIRLLTLHHLAFPVSVKKKKKKKKAFQNYPSQPHHYEENATFISLNMMGI
jgi:hypothetical protein